MNAISDVLTYDYDELARATRLSRSYLEHHHARLHIPSVVVGRRRLFPRQAVAEWLDRRLKEQAAKPSSPNGREE
jgi:excisionase family DNA binding protein